MGTNVCDQERSEKMRKIVVAVILSLLVGVVAGCAGCYYKYVYVPQAKAREMAREQQEKINKATRHGEVVSVEPDKLTVKVEYGGGDVGQTVTYKITENTPVAVGYGYVNKPGEKADLTKYFHQGDTVHMMVKGDTILYLNRGTRKDEQARQSLQEQKQ